MTDPESLEDGPFEDKAIEDINNRAHRAAEIYRVFGYARDGLLRIDTLLPDYFPEEYRTARCA